MAEIDDRRTVAFERGNLNNGLICSRIDLPERRVRIDPLRILFIPVEDIRLTGEAGIDQLFHVLHRRTVAKGEAKLGVEALLPREVTCP